MKFLVVDDDENSRVMLTALLEGRGFSVVNARNGLEALAIARNARPDMIISDILMPEMDGFTLCREIKSDPDLAHIPVIFYTATFRDIEDKQLARSLGVSRFIIKPLDPESFAETIDQITEEYRKGELPIPKAPKISRKKRGELHEEALSKKLQDKVDDLEKKHEALRLSEEKYRNLVESLHKDFFFYSHDTEGNFTYISPSITNILGYTQDEFLIHYTEYLTDNPVNKEIVTKTERAIQGEEQPLYELEIFHKNGTIRQLEIKDVPVLDLIGNVIAIDGIGRDITERKRAEEKLRQREVIVASSSDMLALMDNEYTYLDINQAYLQAFGMEYDQVVGKTPSMLFGEAFFNEVIRPHAESCLAGAEVGYQDWFDFPVLGKVYMDITYSPYFGVDNEVKGFVVNARNITESRKAEEKEKASRELVASITKAQNQFIADVDPNLIFSKLLENILSLSQSQYGFIGELLYTDSGAPYIRDFAIQTMVEQEKFQSFMDKYAPPNLEFYNLDNLFGEVIKTGKPVISNDPARDPRRGKIGPPPGHPRLDCFLGLPLYHGAELVGMIGMSNREGGYDEELAKFLKPFLVTSANIIEAYKNDQRRKAAEEKLKIAQKQLLVSEKLAGIGELAAGVSHEVLNPLNIISVQNQMLKKKRENDPKLQTFCSKLQKEIKRIEKIMSSLLIFSCKGEPRYEKITVKIMLEEVKGLIDKDFSLDNIAIESEFCDPPAEVLADKDKMRQVFLNLIHNARNAMPKGGTLTLKCKRYRPEDLNVVRITISDTGVGIKKENLEKIFDPFYTTRPEGKGTGMGLSIVHGIVEEHGGTITVESEEGKGTTFNIDLPIGR